MAGSASLAASADIQQSADLVRPPSNLNNAAASSTVVDSSNLRVAPPTIHFYFSKSQLALSLSIAKSKPPGLPIKEYCLRLRQRITMSSSSTNRQNLRHVDGCEFWKDLHDTIYQENSALHAKIAFLEEKLRNLEHDTTTGSEDQGERTSRKRLADCIEIADRPNDEICDEVSLVGDPHFRLSSHTVRIIQERRNLAAIISNSHATNHIDKIWSSACSLNKLLETAFSDCQKLPLLLLWSLKCGGDTQKVRCFQQFMTQIALGFGSSFDAMNELGKTIPGRKKRAEIVTGLVYIFKQALDYLHTVSGLQAADNEAVNDRERYQKRARVSQSEYAVNKYLSKALVHMTQREWKTENLAHSEVLEGILCSVLTSTGHLLSHTIFKEHVAASEKPGNISLGGPTSQIAATKFEFRYIIQVLHAALGGDTKRELIAKILEERCSDRSASLGGHLLSNAKKLLQATLVKSAVGADVDSLKLPEQLEIVEPFSPGVSHRVEQYDSVWFLEAVWTLVGWEMVV